MPCRWQLRPSQAIILSPKSKVDHVGVRRLLVIGKVITTAARGDAARGIHARPPTTQVERVDSVVAQLAGAPMPEPVPVVMDHVVAERSLRRRSLPQPPVQPRRHGRGLAMTDRTAGTVVPAAREENPADGPGAQLLHRLDDRGRAAALRADLDNTVEFLRRRRRQFAFIRVVAGWFFAIDMLPRGAGEDRRRRVPMIRCRDHQRVHSGVFNEPADILHGPGRKAVAGGLDPFGKGALVHVADGGNLHSGQGCEAADQVAATTVHAHETEANTIVGTERAQAWKGAGERRRPGRQGQVATKEFPTGQRR